MRRQANVRWRDGGWELRCEDCKKAGRMTTYWPLTDEFWNRASMIRCRDCNLIRRRKRDYETYWRNAALRARKAEESRAYRAEAGDSIKVKRRDRQEQDAIGARLRYWRNPEMEREKARAYYWRNRDAIVEKRRERYHQDKAA